MRFFIIALLLVSLIITSIGSVIASDGDPVVISTQNPASGYIVAEADDDVTLSFSFTGDYANCSLYGNWSGGWSEKGGAYNNATPALYNFDVATSNFVCNNYYNWNVFCVEDNNSANFDWGENRTFFFECVPPEEEPIAPVVKKTYTVLLNQPWYGEAKVGYRWIFENVTDNGTSYYNLYVTNLTAYTMSVWAIPSNINYTIDLTTTTVDIDLHGDKINDIKFTMERLYAYDKAMVSFSDVNYVEPVVNNTANETLNITDDINVTENTTIDINVTDGFVNETINVTANLTVNETVENDTSEDAPIALTQNQETDTKDPEEGSFPLWIIALILLIMITVVVYLAYNLMAPMPS